jgi:hypothetical protein
MFEWEIVELLDGNNEWRMATISEGLTKTALSQYKDLWIPELIRQKEPDSHWDWKSFWEEFRKKSRHAFFRLECEGSLEGLMWIEKDVEGRISPSVVYIHRLCAAPWNRTPASTRRLKPIGMVLLRQAVLASLEGSSEGAIGLHSLPKAAYWYANSVKMTSFGADGEHEGLTYFEFSRAQAQEFLKSPQ